MNSLTQRLDATKQTWQLFLPDVPMPEDYQLARWASRFSQVEIEYAIRRTSDKIRSGKTNPLFEPGRYTTGILCNERKVVEAATQNAAANAVTASEPQNLTQGVYEQ